MSTSSIDTTSSATREHPQLPCRTHDPDIFFGETDAQVQRAKALCRSCPARRACLAGALARAEPWGVWGGELLAHGAVVAHKRGRGRPPRRYT